MVITVTLNPAMDKTLIIENFTLGEVNRASKVRYDIGGKGINVSKVLKELSIDSICTGFLGGIWEEAFKKELDKRKINHSFISLKGNTRTNTKVVDLSNKVYTDINEPGPEISEEDLNKFIENFSGLCKEKDIVVLSGGVSPGIPKNIYGTLTKIAKAKGAMVILDAEGPLLEEGLKEKPHIIKPNEHELRMLTSSNFESRESIVEKAENIRKEGIEKILVSLGHRGAIYVTEKGVYDGRGLKVLVKSTVGAGDSMVAALVYSIINHYEDIDTLAFAQSCGAATVALEGTEACTFKQIEEFLVEAKANIKLIDRN